jgi:signal transduction histidine kinase
LNGLRRALIALAFTALAVGVLAVPVVLGSHHVGPRGLYLASALAIGWSFAGVGLLLWWRRPENRVGMLMSAVGITWLLRSLTAASNGYLIVVGLAFTAIPYALLALMLVSFPDGRLHTRLEWAVIVGAAIDTTLLLWAQLAFLSFSPSNGCSDCSPNPLLVSNDKSLATALNSAVDALALVAIAGLIVVLVRRWRSFAPRQRPALAPVLWTGGAALAILGAGFAALFSGVRAGGVNAVSEVALLPLVAVPYAFLAGMMRSRFTRAGAVNELVASLNAAPERRRGLQDAMADAFGDPSLVIAYWLPERADYVDADGHAVALPDGSNGRSWTPVQRDGAPLAAIVHDAALAEERDLLETAGAAAGLALENERLHAELRARVEELERSRERIIEAGLAERRKLERNLHDGAQQRLIALALTLRLSRDRLARDLDGARGLLEEAMVELDAATAELRELARGIHPAVLSDRGLPAAVRALAGRVPVPVEIVETPADRLPPVVEIAGYYVIAEALTNITRYARASCARVKVSQTDGSVTVEVTDDGVGGAEPGRGSGLRGLADRVAALDGRLEVESAAGRGTTIRARIPCA